MLRNYLLIAFRNLKKNKVFSLINISGLAVGMAACLLILQYVTFELSYDTFHSKGKNIYRIREEAYQHGILISKSATTIPALAPAMKADLPEVANATRIVHTSPFMADPVMEYNNESYLEKKIYFVDAAILDMFSFNLVKGNVKKALSQPYSAIISSSMAHKYFGKEEPLGKALIFHQGVKGKQTILITGVFEDVPANSHFKPDFLISFSSLPKEWNLDEEWDWGNFYVYVELTHGTDPKVIEAKIPAFLNKYIGKYLHASKAQGYTFSTTLQPLQDIHLYSDLQWELETNGSGTTIWLLCIIAFFILLIAWVNYINLSTAQSMQRAREVGIRKVVGSTRLQLIRQFLTESLLINLAAVILAITIIQLFMPYYQKLTGTNIPLDLWHNPWITWTALGLFLLGTILSGLYPAFVLSAYRPVEVLKGRLQHMAEGVLLRKSLVVFQFTASIALIAGTFIVKQQLSFMQNHNLGMNIDQILVIKGPSIKDSTYQGKADFFKQELSAYTDINKLTMTSSIPGMELSWARDFRRKNENDRQDKSVRIVAVDEDFFEVYQTQVVAGRAFSQQRLSDKDAVIFNETAIRLLGFTSASEAVGKQVIWQESDDLTLEKTIIGVIRDFNQQSLKSAMEPIVFSLKKYTYAPWAGEYYSLKVKAGQAEQTITKVEQQWKQTFAGNPFEYFFLDEQFNNQYKADQQFSQVLSFFSGLAIFVACLGLFGLASFTTTQRTKEIGVRKILGASVYNILLLLSKDFIKLVLVATLIAWSLAYWGIKAWLQNYAFQTEITLWLFIIPAFMVIFIAGLTISVQTIKAARSNPVKSLRYE